MVKLDIMLDFLKKSDQNKNDRLFFHFFLQVKLTPAFQVTLRVSIYPFKWVK